MSETPERWAPIPGHQGYEASDRGRIRSIDRVITRVTGAQQFYPGKIVRAFPIPRGYLGVFLGKRRRGYVHRFVLETFVGPCPEGMEACHGPNGVSDNSLANLRWDTKSANAADMIRAGNKTQQRRTHCPTDHRLVRPNLVLSQLPNRKCMACNRGHARVAWLSARGRPADFKQLADAYYADIMDGVAA
jgi:hypothetical protein